MSSSSFNNERGDLGDASYRNGSTTSPTTRPNLANWTSDSHCTFVPQSALHVRLGLSHSSSGDLFTPSDFSLTVGSVTGLVGTNGAGKTSIARVLPHLPGFPKHQITVQYVSSEEANRLIHSEIGKKMTPLTYLRSALDDKLKHLRQQMQDLEDDTTDIEAAANQLAELYELEDEIVASSERDIQLALHQLGFQKTKTLGELSSGWRYKCCLVAAFLVHPDLIIIDEPSFLDGSSTEWLIRTTRQAAERSMVLLISHKDALLEALCDRVLYINSEAKTLTMYNCGYQDFCSVLESQRAHAASATRVAQKHEAQAAQSLRDLQKQLHRREHKLKAITSQNSDQRFIKGKNKEAKQKADRSAASKLHHLQQKQAAVEEMSRLAQQERVKPLRIEGVVQASDILVTLEQVSFAYEEQEEYVLKHIDVQLHATDRVLVTGSNGVGKTTLIRLLLGELEPTSGSVTRRMGQALYFPQTALSDLNKEYGNMSALDYLGSHSLTETHARQHLGNFGLAKDLALRPIHTLSAGQRVRLWLAKQSLATNHKPSLLVLDEISENVDKETRRSLVDLLHSFEGAVVVLSHDEDFCNSFEPRQIWELSAGCVKIEYVDVGD